MLITQVVTIKDIVMGEKQIKRGKQTMSYQQNLNSFIQKGLYIIGGKIHELQKIEDIARKQKLYENFYQNLLCLHKELNSTTIFEEKNSSYLLMYQGDEAFDR